MPTHIRATVLLIVALTVAVSTSLSSLRPRQPTGEVAQDQKALQRPQDEDEEQYPTVDYDSLGAADPEKKEKRKVKNARHDKSHIVKEDNPMVRRSVYHSEWDLGLPALPIARSGIIISGVVLDANAYLSNDRTGIYSEFTVKVDDILKSNGSASLTLGGAISVERSGGAVRYPSGRKLLYVVAAQRMPRVGHRYLFFLEGGGFDQNFVVVTAYELKTEHVVPLDDAQQFRQYNGVKVADFLEMVRSSVAQLNPGAR